MNPIRKVGGITAGPHYLYKKRSLTFAQNRHLWKQHHTSMSTPKRVISRL